MPDQRQVTIVGVWLQLLQFAENEHDVGFAAQVDIASADIGRVHLGHQRRIARKVLLDAGDKIASRGKVVREERVFGVLYGVAIADDGDGKFPKAVISLHLVVAAHREVDGYGSLPRSVEKAQRLMADGPLADGQILATG